MAIRDTLKANLDVALASSNVSVSSELPYSSGGEPLYFKNMKYLYLDEDNVSKTELFNNLDNNDIIQTDTTVTGYLSVDAKNQPDDIDTIVSDILNSRNSVSSQPTREVEMTTEIDADRLLYTFNFNFITFN